jgi:predicted Zn-dependent peptidase
MLVLRRTQGRPLAAALVCVRDGDLKEKPAEAGALGLGLALAARGGAAGPAPAFTKMLAEAGASLSLVEVSQDALALELVAPPSDLPGLLSVLVAALADPAFAYPDFPQADYDAAMKDFRIRRLREDGDPAVRAEARLREEIYGNHPYAPPRLGTESSLLALTRAEVAERWKSVVGSERVLVSAVGDLDIDGLAALLGPSLARLGTRGKAPLAPPGLPIRNALVLEPMPTAQAVWLRADFAAPEVSSPDYPALLVALAMLDDLLRAELGGTRPVAYGAYTRLSLAAIPSGSIAVARTMSAAIARQGVERAMGMLAGGLCLAPTGRGYVPLADALPGYRLSATFRLYAHSAGAAAMAENIARDLAAGGDGSAWFRMADRIARVTAEDVVRVASERLIDGPVAWAAAGPTELLKDLQGQQ